MRTHLPVIVVLGLLALLPAGCSKPEPEPVPAVLANPGFEQPLDSGWLQTVVNGPYPTDSGTIERSDTLGQPGSGFAVRVYKYHREHAVLSQTVPVETIGQTVKFWARLRIGADVPCSPVAAVVFNYLDSAGNRLARTLICRMSSYCTWTDSDSQHLRKVTDTTGTWTQHSLNLETELDSFLPNVPQESIKRLRVELYAYVDYSG